MSTIGSKLDPKKPGHATGMGRNAALPFDNLEAAVKYLAGLISDTKYDATSARNLAIILQGAVSNLKADVHRLDGQIALRAQVFN